ncbi:MAG TPA: AarF/ABC1/UbiB kinase family protein, partial [Chitinophagales bacterium]|nr:AarF/ABC1/UbiB kinase family protein [Chitinophagales bacterium]
MFDTMLGVDFKLLRRYRQIVGILIKYGFEDILAGAGVSLRARMVEALLPKTVVADIHKYTRWERIRMAVEELGTTYIKLAQILSNRPDVIPLELVAEFEKLQTHVPPFPGEEARKIVEEEIGKNINDVFLSFEDVPFASASIAQVHKAKLKDGTLVVLKVRRPDILEKIELDIIIMKYFARKMEERGYFVNLDPVGIVRAFDNAIHKEVDLSHEGYNLQRFANNFAKSDMVYVPKYYPQYTGKKLLTMEFIDGVHPYDTEGLKRIGISPHELARNGMFALFQQIFEHGFFHADPHPGNMFALPGNKVCFIDFGMMGTVLKADVEFFADIVFGVTSKDSKTLIWGLKNIALSQQFEGNKTFDYEVEDLINDYHALPADKMNMSDLFNRLLALVNKYTIKMPPDYFLLSKCLVTIEGVGHRLDPNLDIIKELTPHINKTLREEFSVMAILKRFLNSARDTLSLIENLPRDIRDIVAKIQKGELKVTIEHEGLDDVTHKIDLASNRIAGGFIIGSILMASAILIAVKFPPLYQHISIPGGLGFILANVLGIRMLFTIF